MHRLTARSATAPAHARGNETLKRQNTDFTNHQCVAWRSMLLKLRQDRRAQQSMGNDEAYMTSFTSAS